MPPASAIRLSIFPLSPELLQLRRASPQLSSPYFLRPAPKWRKQNSAAGPYCRKKEPGEAPLPAFRIKETQARPEVSDTVSSSFSECFDCPEKQVFSRIGKFLYAICRIAETVETQAHDLIPFLRVLGRRIIYRARVGSFGGDIYGI